jgi:hypothetical protein
LYARSASLCSFPMLMPFSLAISFTRSRIIVLLPYLCWSRL